MGAVELPILVGICLGALLILIMYEPLCKLVDNSIGLRNKQNELINISTENKDSYEKRIKIFIG